MPNLFATESEPVTDLDLSFRNGGESPEAGPEKTHYWSLTTLEHLPGTATIVSVETTGEELGRLFSQQPDLPGVILFEEDRFAGVISQDHYYKRISRAFGREIYHRRPSIIMLEDVTVQPLILSADCQIPAAVEQCLTRPLEQLYEPFLVHNQKTGEYRLCALQVLLLTSAQLAGLRNRQMEQILNSVTDGLLVIDKNFRIGGEYSRVVEQIFEHANLREATLPDILRPLLDPATYEQVLDYLRILFDPKLIDRLIKSINPAKQISARFASPDPGEGKRTKHFAFNFERIRTQDEISQVLVRIEDITQRMNLALELAEQEAAAEEKLQLVMQILQVEPTALNRFLDRFDEASAALGKIPEEPPAQNARATVHALFRQVHTLKSEAAFLRLTSHQQTLHQLEDHLDQLRSSPQLEADHLDSLRPSRETLQKLSKQTHQALDQLKYLSATTNAPASKNPAQPPGLVENLGRLVDDLSKQLGKPASFHTTVRNSDLPERYTETLQEVLLHLARNAMVHGIEGEEVRTARGKNPAGLIQIEVKAHPEFHEIIFQDDGNGLDYEKIRRRAEQLGWKASSDEELRHAIFEPGFSTADKITDLAGRGVGLDAIRTSLHQVGGHIVPHSEPGAYCAFQILLPKSPTPAIA